MSVHHTSIHATVTIPINFGEKEHIRTHTDSDHPRYNTLKAILMCHCFSGETKNTNILTEKQRFSHQPPDKSNLDTMQICQKSVTALILLTCTQTMSSSNGFSDNGKTEDIVDTRICIQQFCHWSLRKAGIH